MKEKKFYALGIVIPAIGLLTHLCMGGMVLDLIFAAASIILNLRKRETHRIRIGMTLAFVIIIGSVFMACNLIIIHNLNPYQSISDLILAILFGLSFY